MTTVGQRTENIWSRLDEISARDIPPWVTTMALLYALTMSFMPLARSNYCLIWFDDNHPALLSLIGKPNSECATSKDVAECAIRARRALDAQSKERHSDPFAISEATCEAVRAYRAIF